MLKDVNRRPRRWADPPGRVRVIEGWHPSEPSRVGYNLIVDDDWVGTFETLESAVRTAAGLVDVPESHLELEPQWDFAGSEDRRRHAEPGLHLVPPVSGGDS
jgi:hypothetical protein